MKGNSINKKNFDKKCAYQLICYVIALIGREKVNSTITMCF